MTHAFVYWERQEGEPLRYLLSEVKWFASQHARNRPGTVVYVLTPEQMQLLQACDEARRSDFLCRSDVLSVAYPQPVPLWDGRDWLEAEGY